MKGRLEMDYIKKPMEIENRSMEIIAPYLEGLNLTPEEVKVYSRIIHSAGDVAYAPIIRIHPDAIKCTQEALKKGCNIYTDVEMVRTGIHKRSFNRYGGKIECMISEPEIAEIAEREGITRAMASMRYFGKKLDGAIVAIGNAPTALFEVLRLVKEEGIRPAVIIGIPVGFVGAADSKQALSENGIVPFVTVEGTKGGSPIAASVINAIMYLLDNRR